MYLKMSLETFPITIIAANSVRAMNHDSLLADWWKVV